MTRFAKLRALLVGLVGLAAVAMQPAPANAGLVSCLKASLDAQGQIAQMAATASATAGCLSTASTDPVMVATIVALSALAASGEFSGSDACHAMINGAVGQLIATALIESGIAGVFGSAAEAELVSFAKGNAGAALEELVPPLSPYLTCGCVVAGSAGDIAEAVKALIADGQVCKDFVEDVAEAFVDAVESGLDAIGEFFGDAWCAVAGCPKPPVIVDCISQPMPTDNIAQFIDGGGMATKSAYDDGATPWNVCYCPAPMVMREVKMGWGKGWQCGCADASEKALGPGICACPGDQHHVQIGNNVTECRSCPPGSKVDPNTSACVCGGGEMLVKTFVEAVKYGSPDACGACPANGAKQGAECIICDPSKGQYARDNWGPFDQSACNYCGNRQQVTSDGHSCSACGTDQYLDGNQQCRSCGNGEVLAQDGKSCFKPADVCRPDQVAKEYVVASYGKVEWVGHTCGCPDGQNEHNGKCVADLKCNEGQDADYVAGKCVNKMFCGAGQTVQMTEKGTGNIEVGYKDAKYACVTCEAGTYANAETNRCEPCPGGSVSMQTGTCTCPGSFANSGGVCRPCAIGWHATASFGFTPPVCEKDDKPEKSCGLRAVKNASGACIPCKRDEMALMNKCVSMTVSSDLPIPDNPLKKASIPSLNCPANAVPDEVNGGCRPCKSDEQAVGGLCISKRASGGKPVTGKDAVAPKTIDPKLADCPAGTQRIGGKCVTTAAPKGQRDDPRRAGAELNCPPRMRANPAGTRCVPDLDDDDGAGGGSRPGARGGSGPSGGGSRSGGGGSAPGGYNYNSKPF